MLQYFITQTPSHLSSLSSILITCYFLPLLTQGQQIEAIVARGDLVSDDLILELVSARLNQTDVLENGWLLDGFPRTSAQVICLYANIW